MIVQICITGNFDIIGDINNYQWYGWYFISILVVLLLSPLLNRILANLNKWYSLILILCLFFITYSNGHSFGTAFNLINQYNNIVYLIFCYCVGCWIKLNLNTSNKNYLFICGCLTFLIIVLNVLNRLNLITFGPLDNLFVSKDSGQSAIFTFIESICIFSLFLNIKIKSKSINYFCMFLGMLSVGIYIFQQLWILILPWYYALLATIGFSVIMVIPLSYLIYKLNNLVKFNSLLFQ
jgi:hypothetical protein